MTDRETLADGARRGDLRQLPAVDRLLNENELIAACRELSRPIVVDAVRMVLDDARRRVVAGGPVPAIADLVAAAVARAAATATGSLRPVINATGVIVHTNLGRAPLSDASLAAMARTGEGFSNLEYELREGGRSSRHVHLEDLLCRLTGAEAALAVNNNAAAVLLALSALAAGRDVVIARGQLVEIGGGFRIPDVMRQSGARLVEVGTTNRSYVGDYEAAFTSDTALLLRVHPSNFRVIGFVHEVSLAELVALAHRHGLPVLDDLGSGALLDTAQYGLAREPLVQESVAAGAGLVCFSGDKLLGGPQAGLIVGRRALVDLLRRHPLARAVRLDKLSIAGLQATLLHYVRGEAPSCIPVWRMIATPLEELHRRASAVAAELGRSGIEARVVPTLATVGGGSLPGETLPSRAVAIGAGSGRRTADTSAIDSQGLEARLRQQPTPVVGRIERDELLLDLRTVLPGQEDALAEAVRQAFGAHIVQT